MAIVTGERLMALTSSVSKSEVLTSRRGSKRDSADTSENHDFFDWWIKTKGLKTPADRDEDYGIRPH
jgi:hypothetical protein